MRAVGRNAQQLRGCERVDPTLSDGQFAVLGWLNKHGPLTLTQLAEHERVSAPCMNRTVNCLEEAGYLMREADEADRRRSNIRLTDSGRDLVARTLTQRDAWLTTRLRDLSKEDRAALARAAELMGDLATL